jgi:hypothetical protein
MDYGEEGKRLGGKMREQLPAEVDEERKQLFKQVINPKKRAFLEHFARSGRVMQSCEAAGIHFTTHYHWKKHDKKYLAAVEQAEQIAADFMEDEIHRRAFDGFDHPVTYEGRITDTYKEYSDNLAMFRLKKLRPEYRDSFSMNQFSGPVQVNVKFSSNTYNPLEQEPDEAQMIEDKRD